MPNSETYDAIVVGARIAGSVTAALLGDAGYRVLVLEKGRATSDTLSTHFFRGGRLVRVLASLGVLDAVLASGAPPLRRELFYRPPDPVDVRGPQDPGDAGFDLSVRRVTLDPILAARAARVATVRENAKVVALLREDDGRVAGVRYRVGEDQHEARARITIGADGRWSAVAAAVEPAVTESAEPIRALYYRYVRGWTGPDGGVVDAAEFSFLDDELAYVFPSDGGTTCLALSIPASSFETFRSRARDAFDERMAAHAPIADRYARTERDGFHGSHPEPGWMRVPAGDGWALVGDAGLHLDPWTGLGMDFAGVHATYLAEAIDEWLSGRSDERAALRRYAERRDSNALEQFRMTASDGRDLRVMAEEAS